MNLEEACKKIDNSSLHEFPYEHIIIDNFLMDEEHKRLIDEIKEIIQKKNIRSKCVESRKTYIYYHKADKLQINEHIECNNFTKILMNNKFQESIYSKFNSINSDYKKEPYDITSQINYFKKGYYLHKHPDNHPKYVSMVYYVYNEENNELNDSGLTMYEEKTDKIKTVNFKQNRLVVFAPKREGDKKTIHDIRVLNSRISIQSWYGFERIKI
jgi:Rps23 Pro-64 3,4-dihydroxylase Tpa1-like proline 4-hydroxylase